MGGPSTLIARAAVARRRLAGRSDWSAPAAIVLGVLAIIETMLRGGDSSGEVSIAVLIGLFTTVPLALAATHGTVTAVTIVAATFVTLAGGRWPTGAGVVAIVIALYLVGRRGHHRVPWVITSLFAVFAVTATIGGGTSDWVAGTVLLALTGTALAIGGARHAREFARRRDAAEQAIADTLVQHAARGERVRIARELHDVVAHHISMIAVQVETARLTTPDLPPDGEKRLIAIGDTARVALTEMRRLLGVLRDDTRTPPMREPQPGLEQLNELIDEARDVVPASTRLIVRGHVMPLDPGVELTAYRIVQEALTNARRHAPGASVDVELTYTDDALRVRVRDNGPGPPDGSAPDGSAPDGSASNGSASNGSATGGGAPGGHGLLGMRERAAMVGGDLRAGPAQPTGFLVEAVLPSGAAP
ncbi:MAG TPA: sensor histidine kinase [Micromonosporaceae bacterium]|nr:sensor histidine kinase [Micromonosporaceae bacterium]